MNAFKHLDELLTGRYAFKRKQKTRNEEFFCVVYTESTVPARKTELSLKQAFATAPAAPRSPRLETIPENEIFMVKSF